MGRPKKTGQDARTKSTPSVRMTEREYAVVIDHAKAASMSISEYIRQVATTGHVVANDARPQVTTFPFELIHQLQKVGVNLNQLTRVANATGGELPKALADAGEDLQNVLDHIITQTEFR